MSFKEEFDLILQKICDADSEEQRKEEIKNLCQVALKSPREEVNQILVACHQASINLKNKGSLRDGELLNIVYSSIAATLGSGKCPL